VWDQIGIRIPQAASLYVGPLYKFSGPSVELRSTLPVFFGNFFYLQSIVSPVFGSNGPLWSLSYEFWYYLLFPALILAAAARERPRGRILHAVLALLLVFFLGTRITAYFAIWLVGALVGRFQRSTNFRTSSPALPLAGGLLFAGSLAWCRLRPLSSDYLTDLIVGCCFALWLYTLLLGSRDDVSPAYEHGARKLAGFSYTLYLTHFPLLLLLRGLFDPQSTWQPDARHLACGLAIALGMLVYAYSVAELTEAHTASVRRGILRRIAPLEIPART
jgi:peptidoglycan/LPS O-acetylase OafA/YrhL